MSDLDDYYIADICSSTHSEKASGNPAEKLHKSMSVGLSEIEKALTDKGKEFFRCWLNMKGELQTLDRSDSFSLGFRLGAKYVYDILMDSDKTNLSEKKGVNRNEILRDY